MTLEKLLIFGFALAVLFAISTLGSDLMTSRTDKSGEVEDIFKEIEGS